MKKLKVNEKAKKIINICCIVCISLLVLFSSFIMVFACVGACTKTAKADEVISNPNYVYNGNNYFVPTSITFNLGYNADLGEVELVPQYDFLKYFLSVDTLLTTSLYSNGDYASLGVTYLPSISFRIYASNKRSFLIGVMPNDNYREFNYDDDGYFTLPLLNDDNQANVVDNVRFTRNTFAFYLQEYSFSGDDLIGYIETDTDISFNCNVQSINFSSSLLYPEWTRRHIKNVITYTDDNGKTCIISFHLWLNSHPNYSGVSSWENRTYYIANGDIKDTSIYQDGYQSGYLNGLNDGNKNSDNIYNDGYNKGLEIGKNLGYQDAIDGQLTAGSFFANMLSILDVPIFGFISLGQILMLGVSVSLVMIALKLFAGG